MTEEKFLQAKPQLFCTDIGKLSHKPSELKIAKVTDLPYYKDYESIVDELYRNLNKV